MTSEVRHPPISYNVVADIWINTECGTGWNQTHKTEIDISQGGSQVDIKCENLPLLIEHLQWCYRYYRQQIEKAR